jgi:hypothetical protein
MRLSRWLSVLMLCLCALPVLAQSDDVASLRSERWGAGAILSGGSGLFDRSNVQVIRAGARVGRVMTGELGPGALRGTFELDAELLPLELVHWGGYRNVYSAAFNPILMKWNFTGGHRLAPYLLAQGGLVWSADYVPPGNTSKVNFCEGPGIGFNYFLKPRRSVNVDLRATHLSNASLGTHNPGINAALELHVGYNWWGR